MNKRRHAKIIREGNYLAEVEVELIDTGEGWSPYLTLEDACKLDDVREALRRGDLKNRRAVRARFFAYAGDGLGRVSPRRLE
jgi:hypothetical protein